MNDLGEQEQTNQEKMMSADDLILKHDSTVEIPSIERDCTSLYWYYAQTLDIQKVQNLHYDVNYY